MIALVDYHLAYPDYAGSPIRVDIWQDAAVNNAFTDVHADDNKPARTILKLRRARRRAVIYEIKSEDVEDKLKVPWGTLTSEVWDS